MSLPWQGPDHQNLDQLVDELSVQNAIQASLFDAHLDGATEEFLRATENIKMLSQEINLLKSTIAAASAATPYHDRLASGTELMEVAQSQPSTPLRSPPAYQQNDLFSIPSRKREWSSGHPTSSPFRHAGPSKSRRMSPSMRSRASNEDHGFQTIDLTSELDEDADSLVLRHQRAVEARSMWARSREESDRLFAIQLSQDIALINSSFGNDFMNPNSDAQPSINHAGAPIVFDFDDMLGSGDFGPIGTPGQASAVANSCSQFSDSATASSTTTPPPPVQNAGMLLGHPTGLIPGAFNPEDYDGLMSWPQFNHNAQTPPPVLAEAQPLTFNFSGMGNAHGFGQVGMNTASLSSTPSPPYFGDSGFSSAAHQQSGPLMPHYNFASAGPMLFMPTSGNPSLASVIQTTERYDFQTMTDDLGNPLDEKLVRHVEDVMNDPRKTREDIQNLLANIRPDMEIPIENREGTPDGLRYPLYPHQQLALTWMKKMEEGSNKGGILADDMGLGKTLSTLALVLSQKSSTTQKTNLIVGPVALIRQWEEECNVKVLPGHRLDVLLYHNRKTTVDEVMRHDIVLTTYGTLAQEKKRLDDYYKNNASRNIDHSRDQYLAKHCPLLHPVKSKFYRVILDEAQCIKNHRTKGAMACHEVSGKYRWCLTGTPMMNGVAELYSLLRFLRIRPYHDWTAFREDFGSLFDVRSKNSKTNALQKLRALIKATTLRRLKNSTLDGKPILELPPKTEELVYARLSPDERSYYDQLQNNAKVVVGRYLRAGTVGKHYSHILVLLLRLRQACCHPHLNMDVEDVASALPQIDMVELAKGLQTAVINRIMAMEAFDCPICLDGVPDPSIIIPCGHDACAQCLAQLIENAAQSHIREGNEGGNAVCPSCRGEVNPKKIINYSTFKKVHMPDAVLAEVDVEEEEGTKSDSASDSGSDSDCDSSNGTVPADDVDARGNLKDFVVTDDESDFDALGPLRKQSTLEKSSHKSRTSAGEQGVRTTSGNSSRRRGKKKSQEVQPTMLRTLRTEAQRNRETRQRYYRYLRKNWLDSAKVTECLKLLRTIQTTGEKTIIFSQWTFLLDLLEVSFKVEQMGLKHCRYDGTMSADARNHAAVRFRREPDLAVMLVSLRAGNAGLNLTAASHVIIMDPFWNPYIEMQAVDRAHRIGQSRPVKVYRILVEDTVEDRIVELQGKKRQMVDSALDEAGSKAIGRLSATELRYIFGL